MGSDYLHLCIGISLQKKHKGLRHASDQQTSNALLLTPYCYLRRNAALCRIGHLHQSRNFASAKGLAVQLERVRASRESDVRTIEWLERERLCELLCGICEGESQSLLVG